MSLTSYIFKPSSLEITKRVLSCFIDNYLFWDHCGGWWDMRAVEGRPGWYNLRADYDDAREGWSETCYVAEPSEGEHLTEGMLIALIENNVAQQDDDGDWYLTDVELAEVIIGLAEGDSSIFSPYDEKLWIHDKKTNESKTVSMIDTYFSLGEAA